MPIGTRLDLVCGLWDVRERKPLRSRIGLYFLLSDFGGFSLQYFHSSPNLLHLGMRQTVETIVGSQIGHLSGEKEKLSRQSRLKTC